MVTANVDFETGDTAEPGDPEDYGQFYLPVNSPCRDTGTTDIDPALLAELQAMTTCAPQDGGWPDINTPDIGYHYSEPDVDSDSDGLPDWWELTYFGNLNQSGSDYDPYGNTLLYDYLHGINPNTGLPNTWLLNYFGNLNHYATDPDSRGVNTLLDDYQHGLDPNIIQFTVESPNGYIVNTRVAAVQLNITAGAPSSYALFVVNSTIRTNWLPFTTTNLTVLLGATDGVYHVLVGLRGLPANATQTWDDYTFTLDRVAPTNTITNPAGITPSGAVVIKPYLQLQGFANEQLASLAYDISNAAGIFTNQPGYVTDQGFDTNLFDFTTNYFQCYDVPLTNGVNNLTVHVTDRAGNTSTTNFNVILDYSTATTPPVVNAIWPQDGMSLSGESFTLRGTMSDETGTIVAQVVDEDNNVSTVNGLVERNGMFWVEDLPLSDGDNTVTLTATDASGKNVTTTSMTVSESDVGLTIDSTPTGNDLCQPVGLVYGTVSDTDYSVTVNGMPASIYDDAGDWVAGNVPINGTGTAVFDAVASPPVISPTTPQVHASAEAEVPPQVVVTTYHDTKGASSLDIPDGQYEDTTGTKTYSANYQTDSTGQWVLHDYNGSLTSTDTYFNQDLVTLEHDYQWANPGVITEQYMVNGYLLPPGTYNSYHGGVDQQLGPITDPMDYDVFQGVTAFSQPLFITQYFANNVNWSWVRDDGQLMAVHVDARTATKLLTGGKAQINRQHLIQLQCSGTEYGQPYVDAPSGCGDDTVFYPWSNVAETPIAPSRMSALGGKKVGADGNLWVALPDNAAMDFNLTAPFRHYYAQATPQKVFLDNKLAVDMNRDGQVNFDSSDATTAANPYCFWLNNNHDGYYNMDGQYSVQVDLDGSDDLSSTTISCTRDLEDYTRLGIQIQGFIQQQFVSIQQPLTNGDIVVKLESSGPQIRIFRSAELDGGISYLRYASAAQAQITAPYNQQVGAVNGGSFEFPKTFWTNSTQVYLLFDGIGAGNGPLVLSIYAKNGTKLGESQPVYLNLQDIKNMYERWSCGNNSGIANVTPSSTASILSPTLDPSTCASQPYILYVHGYNVTQPQKEADGQTAFKRLWWQGYKGRFGLFEWPTTTPGDSSIKHVTAFDMSEYIALNSAPALEGLLNNLNQQYQGNVYLFAHSHGNMVVGEALRKAALDNLGQLVNTYVACQAAVAVHCYDSGQPTPPDFFDSLRTVHGVPLCPTGPDTPNIYPNWFATGESAVVTMGNFFNVNDYCLSHLIWETDEAFKPDSVAGITPPYGYHGSPDDDPPLQDGFRKNDVTSGTPRGGITDLSIPLYLGTPANLQDRYEIIAFAAEPRCIALGRTPNANGFKWQDLQAIWPYDPYDLHNYASHPWHSGEFNFDTVMQNGFWAALYGPQGFNLK